MCYLFAAAIIVGKQDETRPGFGQDIREVYARREPLYKECSAYDFEVVATDDGTTDWTVIHGDFCDLLRRIERPVVVPTKSSFFISLTQPTYSGLTTEAAAELGQGVAAIEARIDLLATTNHADVVREITLLRRASFLPIIFTVRSAVQGGGYQGSEADLFALLNLGVRLGCEYVDMETCWADQHRSQLLANRNTARIICSYHHVIAASSELWQTGLRATELTMLHNEVVKAAEGDIAKVP